MKTPSAINQRLTPPRRTRDELDRLPLRPEPRFLPPKAMMKPLPKSEHDQQITTEAPRYQPGQLITFSYIPRGEYEARQYPAIVNYEHDGNVALILVELIDGQPRPRDARVEKERTAERWEAHAGDPIAKAMLKVRKNHRIMTIVKEKALSENRATEHHRRESDRAAKAAANKPGGTPRTPQNRLF